MSDFKIFLVEFISVIVFFGLLCLHEDWDMYKKLLKKGVQKMKDLMTNSQLLALSILSGSDGNFLTRPFKKWKAKQIRAILEEEVVIDELKVKKIIRALTANEELKTAVGMLQLTVSKEAAIVELLELTNQKTIIEVQQGIEDFKKEQLENKLTTKKLLEKLNDNEGEDRE